MSVFFRAAHQSCPDAGVCGLLLHRSEEPPQVTRVTPSVEERTSLMTFFSLQGSGASAQPSGDPVPARPGSRGGSLRGSAGGRLPSAAVAAEAALPAPPAHLGLLLPGRLLLLPASVRQPAEAAGEAQAALTAASFVN